MRNWRRIAGVLAGVLFVGMGAGDRAHPLRAQISERPSQQPFVARPGTTVPQGFEVLRVLGHVYVIAGAGANVVVQAGPQGLLVVDSGATAKSKELLDAFKTISDKTITYVINTGPDLDHFGGNEALAAAGWSPTVARPQLTGAGTPVPEPRADPRIEPAMVIAHEGMMNRVSAATGAQSTVPFGLWPTSTFFTPKKTMSFNHEGIELLHQPSAHTDGDLMVFFRKSDVIAVGDLIDTGGYPRFDPARGGSIQGLLDGLNRVIDLSIPEFNQQGGTRIVPGHGRVMNESDVADYRDMVTIIRDRVRVAVDKKLTLAQFKALRPTLDYDGLYARPDWTGEMFVEAIHNELSQAHATPRDQPR